MQYLKINNNTTLQSLSAAVGRRNVDSVLVANDLKRSPDIGKQFKEKSDAARETSKPVSWQQKANILNTFTSDAEVYEAAALLSEDEWKVLDTLGTLPGTLRIPETIKLPDSTDVIGGSSSGVSTTVYAKSMKALMGDSHSIDPAIFTEYSTIRPAGISETRSYSDPGSGIYNAFAFPWGKIQLYSSLAGSSVDFPVYPEELSDGRTANYTTMPDTIYQYEPWYAYESSGPRQVDYTFKFHRDMWSGDHKDGKANELIRFCEANCYPEYNGSAVNTSTVSLYINGTQHISGIMTKVSTKWDGPIGHDGWYLSCELTLSITEVAKTPRTFGSMRQLNVIGG